MTEAIVRRENQPQTSPPHGIALASEVRIEIEEERIPVREEVKGACEILGLDPLYVADEGKLLALVAARYLESDKIVHLVKALHKYSVMFA